ncbi:MAG: DUF4886 domain-containing protein, partial [Clostridia bacterium]|nr:DUF4886 domain-containing protein [Clostridia bacterium]
MKNLKWLGLALLMVACVFFAVACDSPDTPDGTTANIEDVTTASGEEQTTAGVQTPTEDPATCAHVNVTETVITAARALEDGEKLVKCNACGTENKEVIPMMKTLKLLCIGNSFTVDPCWHLWGICNDAGIENVVVATLFIGNCTFRIHWNNMKYDYHNYGYYKATAEGDMVLQKNVSAQEALDDEDWDAFIFHQSGLRARTNDPTLTTTESTMTELPLIVNHVREQFPNALMFFQMAWAYQADCTQTEFVKFYGGDQQKNYDSVITTAKDIVPKMNLFDYVIPVGTAAQNMRTSYIGDNITRDGYHLNYGFGRYMASLTWYTILTGGSIDNITWTPSKYTDDINLKMPVIKESIKNALKTPFEVTQSQ